MKRKLEMDDIREGMYITVLKGKMEKRLVPGPNGPTFVCKEKDHYNGKVLEVLTIDMPYISIRVYEQLRSRVDTLDLRQIEVMALSPEYIHSLFPDMDLKVDPFWIGIDSESINGTDVDIEEIFKDL
jgi:hypothetical protein